MRTYTLKSKSMSRKLRAIARSFVRVTALDAVLGAVCGGLYGMVFGGLGALVHNEAWRLFSIAGRCALAGFAVGASLGLLRSVFEKKSAMAAEGPPARATSGVSSARASVSSMSAVSLGSQSPTKSSPAKVKHPVRAIAG